MTVTIRLTCVKVSSLVLFLLFFQLGFAQTDLSALDAKVQQYQKPLGGSLAIMVYKDDKVVYSKAVGTDFNFTTQAPIGRSTEWLTTALVMQFVDEGKISLDDKVSKYLPIFNDYSKGYITIRQCLTHETGIEGDKVMAVIMKSNIYPSLEAAVNSYAGKHEIQTNPGTEFRYSNIGLDIAGRVLEIVGKRSIEQLAQQRLFRPLGMRNTSYQLDFDKAASPSGGAYSSAADYLNFLSMILNKGMFKGKRILSEKAIDEMTKIQADKPMIKAAPKACEGFTYSLGAWVSADDGNGKATALTNPGLYGDLPIIDFCRGYACIVFVKNPQKEQEKSVYTDIKGTIDAQVECK